jgi:hypothetical protein
MSGWQPIETAPRDGTVVVVFRGNVAFETSFGPSRDFVERCDLGWFEDGNWWQSGTGHDFFEPWAIEIGHVPTHWMPLPDPPPSERESGD